MCKTDNKLRLTEYTEKGYYIIKNFLSSDDIKDFEKNLMLLCNMQTKLRSLGKTCNDPLIDLFKVGGAYRKILYTHLQDMKICKVIEYKLLSYIENDTTIKALKLEVPVLHAGIRVDIPGEEKFLTPAHQDIYSCRCKRSHRLWVPLRDVDEIHGTFKVYEGSHKKGYIEPNSIENPEYPTIDPIHYEKCKEVIIRINAGDAVFFNPLLIHKSVPPKKMERIKFIVGVDIQDLATLGNPDDKNGFIYKVNEITKNRAKKRDQTTNKR